MKWLFKVCNITSMETQFHCLSKFIVLSTNNVHVHSKGNLWDQERPAQGRYYHMTIISYCLAGWYQRHLKKNIGFDFQLLLDLTLQITSNAALANWSIMQTSVFPSAIVPRCSSKRFAVELKELISSLRLLIQNKVEMSPKPLERLPSWIKLFYK